MNVNWFGELYEPSYRGIGRGDGLVVEVAVMEVEVVVTGVVVVTEAEEVVEEVLLAPAMVLVEVQMVLVAPAMVLIQVCLMVAFSPVLRTLVI